MPFTRRTFLAHGGLTLAALSLGACASAPAKPKDRPDAIVDAAFGGKPGSLVAGTPTYRSVQEALDSSSAFGDWWIHLKRGRYVEKLTILKSGLRLTGEATSLQAMQRELSTAPAIDHARVQAVREATEEEIGRGTAGTGFFRIQPQAPGNDLLH